MKLINIAGVILIIVGVLALSYEGFRYSTPEQVAELGDLKMTVEKDKRVTFPPYSGGIALAAGVLLLAIGRRK